MAVSARSLSLFAVILGVALIVNGYFLYQAFNAASNGRHYRIVLNAPDTLSQSKQLQSELRKISGVSVQSQEVTVAWRKPTGKFWVGKELDEDLTDQILHQLKGFNYSVLRESVGNKRFIVRLSEEYPDQATAAKVQKQVDNRVRLFTVKVIPACRVENGEGVQLDLQIPDDDKLRTVKTVTTRYDVEVIPDAE